MLPMHTGVMQNENELIGLQIAKIDKRIRIFLFAAAIFAFLGGASWTYGWHLLNSPLNESNFGNFGSYLQGTVGSLWSLAGFFLILVAFQAQQKQNLFQDAQFKIQQAQAEKQFESIKRQNFENSFFQLLNSQNQLVSELKFPRIEGRQCFYEMFRQYNNDFDQWLRRENGGNQPTPSEKEDKNKRIRHWESFFNQNESHLAHYFRNLYHIIKYIDTDGIEPKRRYTSLVRAQLSIYELIALFYNCLGSQGKGFKHLVERYGLLEHLDKNAVPAVLINEYDQSAFK